jgi:hypothetical protein
MGSSSDFHIGHDGTNNIIDAVNNHSIRIQAAGSNMWEFGSAGILKGNDGKKIILGDSSDLQLYHNGNHSYIKDAGTGNLIVSSSQMQIVNAAEDEMIARFDQDGAVELYYDSAKQLETTENGVLITKGVIRGNGGSKAIIAGTINPSQDKTWNFSFGTNDHGYNQGYIFNVKFYMNHWNTGSYYKYIESITGGRGNVTGLERVNLINNLGGGGSGWSNGHLDYSVSLTGGTRDGNNVSLFKVTYDADGAPAWTSGYYLEVNYGSQLGTINIT